MKPLLQTLLLQTLPSDIDPVLLAYVETVLPAVEQEFGLIPVSNDVSQTEQSLLVHILNSLLTAWNLFPFLSSKLALSDNEKRLLCLSLIFQNDNSKCQSRENNSPPTLGVNETLKQYRAFGDKLNLAAFWTEWREYLTDIVYLTQSTQPHALSIKKTALKIPANRLELPLRPLLLFGAIAAQLTDPADIVIKPEGNVLKECLKRLGVQHQLTYHRVRACTGLLTEGIHNAIMRFVQPLDWQSILFFAQGIVYLVPSDSKLLDCSKLQTFIWEQISEQLAISMLRGKVGFKRDGKGMKAAPQTLELFSPAQFIRNLPTVINACVKNETEPATPKRLANLDLDPTDREFLACGADLRSDRIAEFILFLQKKFFGTNPEFIDRVLDQLGIQSAITPEQTQIFSSGVNRGWYHAAAYYVASNPHLDSDDVTIKLQEIANQLVDWAEEKELFPPQISPTREVFNQYLAQYLEFPRWNNSAPSFQHELATYVAAKTKAAKQPICSLSSSEFDSEDQLDSVVLFKPQQYSNKNPLGGWQLKRGISKLWSLEMLLRQSFWSVSAGKLEERQPVFLYFFPSLVHSPQVAKAIRILVNQLKRVNLWKVCRFWQVHGMNANTLRFYSWLKSDPRPDDNGKRDLPFLAITYTTTAGKTTTQAWIEPAFLVLALSLVLGIKVVATASPVPLYNRSSEFPETVKIDGPASFWSLLGLPTSIRLEEKIQGRVKHLNDWLDRLLIAYSIHLDCQANPPDSRWQLFPGTVQAITTDVSAIFSLAHSHFQSLSDDRVQRYWHFAQVWAAGDSNMEQQLELTQRLVQEYRAFYQVHVAKATHAIVLPLLKVLEEILSTPSDLPIETLILQTSGRLHDALKRQEPYKRPLIMDQSLSIEIRVNNEIQAIQRFVTTCINDLFLAQYKGDRALLQEHRNRIKSGAEFAYRLLAMQEPKPKTKKQEIEGAQI
ncbi:MAG: type I-D CRISPR-associated protein Cas10d/Csc3 [Myxacorys californica WJT36-NPBG1]|jgi:CRISPR-associated protein Csc3|nr:type I-D CRISPR-associated protein Cas10d/Csc3 [Myxacorys californica WJT36-NPBG1]